MHVPGAGPAVQALRLKAADLTVPFVSGEPTGGWTFIAGSG